MTVKSIQKEKKKRVFKRKPYTRRAPLVDAFGNPRKTGLHKCGGAIDKRFDDNILQTIEKALKLGFTKSMAATNAGITVETFNRWMAEGASAKEGCRARLFYDISTKAINSCLGRHIMVINKCAWEKGDAKVSQWYLEKMCKEFEPKMHVGGIQDNPVEVDIMTRGKSLEASLKAILKKKPELKG